MLFIFEVEASQPVFAAVEGVLNVILLKIPVFIDKILSPIGRGLMPPTVVQGIKGILEGMEQLMGQICTQQISLDVSIDQDVS